jgi:serine/threonine protein phosphatase PrpC
VFQIILKVCSLENIFKLIILACPADLDYSRSWVIIRHKLVTKHMQIRNEDQEIYTEAELLDLKVSLSARDVFGDLTSFECVKDEYESEKMFELPDGSVVFVYGATSKGNSDTDNQDSVVIGENLIALADGVSTSENPKDASREAVIATSRLLPDLIKKIGEMDCLTIDNIDTVERVIKTSLINLVEDINDIVFDLDGTTTIDFGFVLPIKNYAGVVVKNLFVTAHVGDGNILRKRDLEYKNIALHQNLSNLAYLNGFQYRNGDRIFRNATMYTYEELLELQDKLISTDESVRKMALKVFTGETEYMYANTENHKFISSGSAVVKVLGRDWTNRLPSNDCGVVCLEPQISIIELDPNITEKFLLAPDGIIDQEAPNINEKDLDIGIDSVRKGQNPAKQLVEAAKKGPKDDHLSAGIVIIKPPFKTYLNNLADLLEIKDLENRKQEMRKIMFDLFEVPNYVKKYLRKGTSNNLELHKVLELSGLSEEFNKVLNTFKQEKKFDIRSLAVILELQEELGIEG